MTTGRPVKPVPGFDNPEELTPTQRYYYRNREYFKNYYQNHKQKMYQQQKQTSRYNILCECGAMVQKSYLPKHRKTKRHLTSLELLKQNKPQSDDSE